MSVIPKPAWPVDIKDLDDTNFRLIVEKLYNWWNLHNTGALSWDNLSVATGGTITGVTGRILQIQTGTTSTNQTTTSGTYSDTGLTVNITPQLSTSKIIVWVSQAAFAGFASICRIRLTATTNGTRSTIMAQYENNSGSAGADVNGSQANLLYVDSPATVATQTYKTQFSSSTGGITVGVNGDGTTGYDNFIVVAEVGQA